MLCTTGAVAVVAAAMTVSATPAQATVPVPGRDQLCTARENINFYVTDDTSSTRSYTVAAGDLIRIDIDYQVGCLSIVDTEAAEVEQGVGLAALVTGGAAQRQRPGAGIAWRVRDPGPAQPVRRHRPATGRAARIAPAAAGSPGVLG
jgi:hypothetical protein